MAIFHGKMLVHQRVPRSDFFRSFFGPPFVAEETAGGRVTLHRGAFLIHATQGDARLRHLATAVHRHHRDGGEGLGNLGHSHLLAWNHLVAHPT